MCVGVCVWAGVWGVCGGVCVCVFSFLKKEEVTDYRHSLEIC